MQISNLRDVVILVAILNQNKLLHYNINEKKIFKLKETECLESLLKFDILKLYALVFLSILNIE